MLHKRHSKQRNPVPEGRAVLLDRAASQPWHFLHSSYQGKQSGEGALRKQTAQQSWECCWSLELQPKGTSAFPRPTISQKFSLPTTRDLILIEWVALPQATLCLFCHRLRELACSSSSFPALAISPGKKIKQISVAQHHHLLQSWSISSAGSQELLLYFTLMLGRRLTDTTR